MSKLIPTKVKAQHRSITLTVDFIIPGNPRKDGRDPIALFIDNLQKGYDDGIFEGGFEVLRQEDTTVTTYGED